MRRLLIGATVLVSLVMAPRLASAQAQQGDREVLVQGLVFTSISSLPQTTFTGGRLVTTTSTQTSTTGIGIFNLGQFLTDTFELGAGPSISFSGGGGNTTVTLGGNAFARKYFGSNRPTIAPFAGLEASVQDFSDVSNQLFVNILAGLKDYVSERAALEMSAGFGVNPSNPSTNQLIQFKIGLTVLFGH